MRYLREHRRSQGRGCFKAKYIPGGEDKRRDIPEAAMPTSTNAEKSLAIAAFTQEMTLAGLMRCQSLGIQVNPAVMGTTRGALLSIYKQAGFPNPESMLQAVEVQLADGLTKMEQNLLIAR